MRLRYVAGLSQSMTENYIQYCNDLKNEVESGRVKNMLEAVRFISSSVLNEEEEDDAPTL